MAKFHGVIGYAIQTETAPGVWQDIITEKEYSGDVILNQQRWQKSENVNDDFNVDNSISIIADPFAFKKFGLYEICRMDGNEVEKFNQYH